MNFSKKIVFIKRGNKVKIISGSKKGSIGRIIKINAKKSFFIIDIALNFNNIKIKLLKKLKIFEAYHKYSEKDFLYIDNQSNLFQVLNEKHNKKEINLSYNVSNIKKKANLIKDKLKNYFVIDYSNVKLFKKNINLLSSLKQKELSQNKFLFLKKLNLIK